MQLRRPRLLAAAAAIALLVLLRGAALAYPEFQLSTGNTRCSLCHIAPAGGGLLNSYGRGESASISQFGGNGDFLYGVYDEPDWIKLGVDLRGALLVRDRATEPELHAFPMQGDTYAWLRLKDFSLYTAVGPRAQVRPERDSFLHRIVPREYWVMWRKKTTGWYGRAGRFFAPFGLRSQDHTLYARRYLGFHTFEETHNLSGGRVENDWEVHLTAFTRVPDALFGNGPRHSGVAAYYERRLGEDEDMVVGAQARAALGEDDRQYLVGGLGKYYLEPARLLLMGELNLGYQDFLFGAAGRPQLAAQLGVTYWPITGVMLGTTLQRYDQDLKVKNLARDAAQISIQYFPLAKWELMLLGRVELQGELGSPTNLAMLQLHYYL
jgi:hypothetical protein